MNGNVIPSGVAILDAALDIQGSCGIAAVLGPRGSGKTTLGCHAIAEAQRLGGRCAFIGVQRTIDLDYAKAIGADLDRLEGAVVDRMEDASRLMRHARRLDLLVVHFGDQPEPDGFHGEAVIKYLREDVGTDRTGLVLRDAQAGLEDLWSPLERGLRIYGRQHFTTISMNNNKHDDDEKEST